MHPVSPVVPQADGDERIIAEHQPEYLSLPCLRAPDGTILTRWILSEEEKRQVVEQGYLYVAVLGFNQVLMPGQIQPLLITPYVPDGFALRPLEEWAEEIDA